jgi:AmmeMemoRadiSam system protein B
MLGMSHSERPQLRPFLEAARDHNDPRFFVIWDHLRLTTKPLRVSETEFDWLRQFDGKRDFKSILNGEVQQSGGQTLPDQLAILISKLEKAAFLEGPTFQARLEAPVREPTCSGCYEEKPEALRRQLKELFTGPNGPGLPGKKHVDNRLRAALVPHIDYARGGSTYGWGFKEVFEHTEASLFVIIGTSHYSPQRFTLTRKDFKSPLGVVATDQSYIDCLVKNYKGDLFKDEICHIPEHSIELEVVILQFLYEKRRAIRIVPLLVGSFQDAVEKGKSPMKQRDITRMVEALRKTESETNEPICYIISGDLAHIGPKFGDLGPLDKAFLKLSRDQDQEILERAEAVDPEGYFQVIAQERDMRRICGLPPTFTLLEAIRPGKAKLLHYDQYVHPRGAESVSFASMAFYQ